MNELTKVLNYRRGVSLVVQCLHFVNNLQNMSEYWP